MPEQELSKEERILRAVKMVLTGVAKDTATAPGLKHPLSDRTIEDIRQCLSLISAREHELAEAAGRPTSERPRYVDEPKPVGDVVVPIGSIRRGPGKSDA
jgi:hypothetical protein